VGRWSANHWKTAVFGWLAFVALSVFIGASLGTKQISQTEANVGESRTADRIISDGGFQLDKNGESTTETFEMVLIQSKTLTTADPAFRAAIADTATTLRTFPQVTKLRSPLGADHNGLISKDRHSVMIQFTPKGSYLEATAYIDTIVNAVDKTASTHPGFTIVSAGVNTDKALDKEIKGGLAKAGMISIPLTIIVLMLILGAFVGALIPLLVALSSVVATTGLLALSSQGIPADQNIMEVVLLIGLAVGVDYSLFYMRREREERAAGRSERAALEAAGATSGRAVLLSGMTVLIAMGGMFLSGDKTFMSFSIGAMLVVAVAMIASLTVLPALLSRLGDKVEKGRIPFVHRLNRKQGSGRVWGALTDRVLRHPVISTVAASAVLLALAIPTLSLHTTATGIEGITSPAVEPFALIMDAFPGTPAPAEVALRADDVNAPAVQKGIADLEQTALATGQMNAPIQVDTSRDGTIAKIEIPLAGTGNDGEATRALATLRTDVLPQTLGRLDGVQYAVTGETANSVDFNKAQTSSIPKVFGFVLLFAFLLLLVSFRSIVIAVKAILLNLLSVGAAYGVMVAFFQWGWGEGILDFHSNGGIANWLPMFMFVILFGLSMDYHVYILSRIREGYDRGLSTDKAISYGIKSTAGTVSSAAFVMVGVFLVFTMLPLVDLKEMGVGLAAAVLIDATIVRGVLLPASMKLLGKANWYLPKRLQWLPRLEHETGPAEPIPAAA
jgi:RND superfamily putative drug exporter